MDTEQVKQYAKVYGEWLVAQLYWWILHIVQAILRVDFSYKSDQPDRRTRSASFMTRYFGHFIASEKPSTSWCVGILKLAKDPGDFIVRDLFFSKLMEIPRFRSKLIMHRYGGHWEEFSEEEMTVFRDEFMYKEVLEDGTATMADVDAEAATAMTWKFDPSKPLWRVRLVRRMADGSACVIFTASHAIGDGMSLVEACMRLVEKHEEPAAPVSSKPRPQLEPTTPLETLKGVVSGLFGLSPPADSRNALSMQSKQPSLSKKLGRAEGIPLNKIKQVKDLVPGATVNDVLMALLTATVKSYLAEVGEKDLESKRINGVFPVNLRSKGEHVFRDNGIDPHNKVAFGRFAFDFDYDDRIDLIHKVKKQIDEIKRNVAPYVQYRFLQLLMKVVPAQYIVQTSKSDVSKETIHLSNVVGPQQKVSLGGCQVEDISFFLYGYLGIYFGIFSYAGTVQASMNMDDSIQASPSDLAKHWNQEFDKLYEQALRVCGDQSTLVS